ncbi:hypothetical protein QBC33DRAFT_523270 [Phialemonium atrogriseum]|uniref:Uncharacterized protein n=1 Tax=Phialemonium atrogriseum TaxID=1093897 RepID=A0AAJ0C9S5_9PEZI|nr:uncharacterized protein QBC33DRAFT_523270 [Phialemonium atrogriseum]KAK1771307.1 hypothetical protein QBC33DRAFT_523270 [Phialemonium atrogriseum]
MHWRLSLVCQHRRTAQQPVGPELDHNKWNRSPHFCILKGERAGFFVERGRRFLPVKPSAPTFNSADMSETFSIRAGPGRTIDERSECLRSSGGERSFFAFFESFLVAHRAAESSFESRLGAGLPLFLARVPRYRLHRAVCQRGHSSRRSPSREGRHAQGVPPIDPVDRCGLPPSYTLGIRVARISFRRTWNICRLGYIGAPWRNWRD